MLSLYTWNISGLNDPSKVSEIKKLIRSNNIKALALLETKVRPHKVTGIMKKFGGFWK